MRDMRAKFEEAQRANLDARESERKTDQARAQILLDRLAEFNSEAERLVESIGTTGLTGNYKRIAEGERSSANTTRICSLVFMSCGLIVIGLALFLYNGNYDLGIALLRVVFGLAFTGPALYLAYESAKHRRSETRSRKAELELASLGPFIAKIPEDKQMEIRQRLVDRFFGQPLEQDNADLPPNIFTLITGLLNRVPKS